MKKRKAERTKEKIIRAFYKLNREPDRPLSTVPEICEELDIAVSTFYCYYTGINDLISQESEKLKEFWEKSLEHDKFEILMAAKEEPFPREMVSRILQGYLQKKEEHLVLMREDLNLPIRRTLYQFIREITSILAKLYPKVMREYATQFVAEGSLPIILTYLKRDDMSVEAFSELLYSLGNAVFRIGYNY